MIRIIILFFISAILIFTTDLSYGQAKQPKRKGKFDSRSSRYRGEKRKFADASKYTAIGLNVNSLHYYGDLAPKLRASSTDLSFSRAGLGLSAMRKYGERYFVRANFMYGRLRGDDFKSADPFDNHDRFRYVRNHHFRNDIKELSIVGLFDFFHNRRTYHYREKLSPYVFGGVAFFHHNPKAIAPATDLQGNPLPEGGKWVNLKPLGTEGQYSDQYDVKPYSNFQFSIPVGLGVRYKWKLNWDFNFEVSYRHLFFDHIDDTSLDYINLDALSSDLSRAMSFRGKEETAIFYNEPRNFNVIDRTTTEYTYTGPDGKIYNVFAGYGVEGKDNVRGKSEANDKIFMATIQITYILPARQSKSKYRR
ncbi:MAG: DUF6089 family protein [Bacteroidota bacterium]|nr:DUF6089 family protein [Bacteroidota bacterium]